MVVDDDIMETKLGPLAIPCSLQLLPSSVNRDYVIAEFIVRMQLYQDVVFGSAIPMLL